MENECCTYNPSFRERFWRRVGYSYHLGPESAGEPPLNGWVRSDMRFEFDWRDRIRLLLTGKLYIALVMETDTPSPEVCRTRIDWRIVEPGGDWR